MIEPVRIVALVEKKRWCRLLVVLLGLATSVASGQTPPPGPLPPLWQAMGLTQWPQPSPDVTLEFDEIVLPGKVGIRVRSSARFTQTLALFSRAANEQGGLEQLGIASLGPNSAPVLVVNATLVETQTLVALAKTPAGWYRTERQIKVGRPLK